ncbi:MAG: hypothetical protein HC915_11830 [Anaerolineae bacterium]|nr:hypothetical protein [Anaerolineae bacterium]
MLRPGALGTRPSTVIFKMTGQDATSHPLLDTARRLCEDSLFVGDVPITLPLRPVPAATEQDKQAPENADRP